MRVELSYEEQIIDALRYVPQKRDDLMGNIQRRFDVIRTILGPLYAERAAFKAELERIAAETEAPDLMCAEHVRLKMATLGEALAELHELRKHRMTG